MTLMILKMKMLKIILLLVANPSENDHKKRSTADKIEASGYMPDWYYQFMFIEEVPAVINC